MDILQPKKNEKLPAIIYITGGGFVSANKDRYLQQRMDLAEVGYVVASIEYRVAPTGFFPQPVEDILRHMLGHKMGAFIEVMQVVIEFFDKHLK